MVSTLALPGKAALSTVSRKSGTSAVGQSCAWNTSGVQSR